MALRACQHATDGQRPTANGNNLALSDAPRYAELTEGHDMPAQAKVGAPTGTSAEALSHLLSLRTLSDPDYWAFRNVRRRSGSHGFFQYPAMMVPELQGALLDDAIRADPSIRTVYDPFTGSGTVLVESLHRGLNFHGTDINPMAVLLAQVKSAPPSLTVAEKGLSQIVENLTHPDAPHEPRVFAHSEKWFQPTVALDLTRLRFAISLLPDLEVRQYFWVCLAETVRLVSNSRISTFKLHAYTPEVLAVRLPDARRVFDQVHSANQERLRQHWARRAATGSQPETHAIVLQGPVTEEWPAPRAQADILMTSPPYGDNKTTVPYGQHSYLPLQWIGTDDIPGGFNADLLTSTSRIDSLSLGGSLRDAERHFDELVDASPALKLFLPLLNNRRSLRAKVLSFVNDYKEAVGLASGRLRSGGFSFFTLGERRVGGELFPLVEITQDLLGVQNHIDVALLERALPRGSKRMAERNSEGATMAREYILVTQKR